VTERDDGFLSRWSRRKVRVQQGAPPEPAPELPAASTAAPLPMAREAAPPLAVPPPAEAQAQPTLADVAQLTRESDFTRFVAPNVDPGVRNAAMKKLFADPHFNVMDGLDTYIDDYNKFEPIPRSMLRQMVNARAMGLLDDELEEQPLIDNAPAHHDPNADLQLQQDDAAGQCGVAQGAAEPVGPGSAGDNSGDSGDSADAADDLHDPVPPRST
jgi:Protein of unknown function (DUF3306)